MSSNNFKNNNKSFVYTSTKLKYPLLEHEMNLVDSAWKFASLFRMEFNTLNENRTNMIMQISATYSPAIFLELEKIFEKIVWNLRWAMFPLWINKNITRNQYNDFNWLKYNEIPHCLLLCDKRNYNSITELNNIVNEFSFKIFYKSFINKLITIDYSNSVIYTKELESSSPIFRKNYFNLLTGSIISSQQLYEHIMMDPFILTTMTIPEPQYYYEFDYGFPNLNLCNYGIINDNDERLDRINKMYFEQNFEDRNWFKLFTK